LRISLLLIGSLLILLLAAVTFLIGTETGTRFLISRVLPDSTKVSSIDGRLIGPLVVEGVRVDAPAVSIGIERAELRWRPSDVLSGTIRVERIRADGVTIVASEGPPEEAEPEAKPLQLPSRIETPLSVELQELVVNDLTYRSSATSELLTIDVIRLSAVASDASFGVQRLNISAPLFDINAAAQLTAQGDYPLSADIEVTLRPEGYAAVRSTTAIDGDLQLLRIHEAIAEPYHFEADAEITNPVDDLRVDVSARLADVNLSAIQADLPATTLSVQANARGGLSDLAMQVNLSATHQQQRLKAELRAALEADVLKVDSLSVSLPEHRTRVDASGRVRLAESFDTDASLSWQNLKWPLSDNPDDNPDYQSTSGRAVVTGSLEDYTLSTEAELVLPGDVPLQAKLSAEGGRENLDADLQLDVLDGHVGGTATVSWQPSLQASLRLDGNDVDPAAFSPDWPGRLDFRLRADADVGQDETVARLETLTVNGELRGETLNVESQGAYETGEFVLDRLRAELGASRITAHGKYSDTASLQWRIASDDLGELLPSATGEVTSEGSLSGAPPRLGINATLHASGLGYQDNRIESLDLTADVDLTDQKASRIVLNVDGVESAALAAERIALDFDGKLGQHRIAMTADTSSGSADLQIDGQLREPWSGNPAWLLQITNATIGYPDLQPWELGEDAEVTLSSADVSVQRHCWMSGPAKLCLAGHRTAERLQAEFSLDELGFDYFATFLPAALQLDGKLSGQGKFLQQTDGPLQADMALETGAGRIAISSEPTDRDGDGEVSETLLDLQPSRLSLVLDNNAADAEAKINFGQGRIDLQAALAASAAPFPQRKLDGRLMMDVPDIAFVAPFVPDIQGLQGSVNGELGFQGTVERPRLSGRLALSDGALESPAAGISLTDLMVALEGRGDSGVGLDAKVSSGGGNLELSGELGLGKSPATTTIDITGEDFQLVGNEEARIFASPDLNVEAGADEVRVTGFVRIPRADITPQQLPESAVTPSEDVVVMTEGDAESLEDPTGRPVFAEVQIVLGDEVRFEGFGLKARFEGDTTVTQVPGQPTSATGEITIAEGEYRAYGQGLVIEDGKVLFAGGPVTEPALDVRAVRRPQEGILVGTRVRGTLEQPDFSLFSEPPMSQQEQLSYLVLGRSLDQAPEGESSALAQASLALGVKGGNFLAENIGGNLGVDEFTIKSGSGEAGAASDPADAAFVIGKYLSPKLYLSYGIGLFNPVSVLTMQYEINRRLKFMTESSSESTGADLVYSFERGD
jgi:translocation and assembly module TamB